MADETDEAPPTLAASLPALLRATWLAYASVTRRALGAAGCDDVPRNGSYVLSAIARGGVPLSAVIVHLGVSKQAAGQLVDTLVLRGYLARSPDPADRRRMIVTLTERGETAAAAIRSAAEDLEAELTARVGAQSLAVTRAALAELAALGVEHA